MKVVLFGDVCRPLLGVETMGSGHNFIRYMCRHITVNFL
jgi:hypothetical protein